MRQQAGMDAQEVQPEHKEEFLSLAVTEHWNRLLRVWSLSHWKEYNHLDTILCYVLWDDPA